MGSVFPGAVLGGVLVQMVQSGLIFVRVDTDLRPLIQAFIVFAAMALGSLRNRVLAWLGRRIIWAEKPGDAARDERRCPNAHATVDGPQRPPGAAPNFGVWLSDRWAPWFGPARR